jgi:hypothetical protein
MVRAGLPDDLVRKLLKGYKEIAQYVEDHHGVVLTPNQICRYANWEINPFPVTRPNARLTFGDPALIDAWVVRWLKR